MAQCTNCSAGAGESGLCVGCQEEAGKAVKMADLINDHLEHHGVKLRFSAETVRAALLANRKNGGK
jgi:hypothetical protein